MKKMTSKINRNFAHLSEHLAVLAEKPADSHIMHAKTTEILLKPDAMKEKK